MAVSPLGAARLRRRLTVEEAAARARMEIDQVKSLEENCMYRFGSNADALAAALVYATALGISEREARQIAGLPVTSRLVDPWSLRRSMAICAFLAALGTLVTRKFHALKRAPKKVIVRAPKLVNIVAG